MDGRARLLRMGRRAPAQRRTSGSSARGAKSAAPFPGRRVGRQPTARPLRDGHRARARGLPPRRRDARRPPGSRGQRLGVDVPRRAARVNAGSSRAGSWAERIPRLPAQRGVLRGRARLLQHLARVPLRPGRLKPPPARAAKGCSSVAGFRLPATSARSRTRRDGSSAGRSPTPRSSAGRSRRGPRSRVGSGRRPARRGRRALRSARRRDSSRLCSDGTRGRRCGPRP